MSQLQNFLVFLVFRVEIGQPCTFYAPHTSRSAALFLPHWRERPHQSRERWGTNVSRGDSRRGALAPRPPAAGSARRRCPAAAAAAAAAGARPWPPGVRSHRRVRNRGTEYVSESGIKWMSGSTKRRALRGPCRGPARRWRSRARYACRPRLDEGRAVTLHPPFSVSIYIRLYIYYNIYSTIYMDPPYT